MPKASFRDSGAGPLSLAARNLTKTPIRGYYEGEAGAIGALLIKPHSDGAGSGDGR